MQYATVKIFADDAALKGTEKYQVITSHNIQCPSNRLLRGPTNGELG